jgi:hypothetical protein
MPTLYTCSVVGAGASAEAQYEYPDDLNGPQVLVALTAVRGAFEREWFYVAEAMRSEILAVALAAISTGHQVNALVDPPEAEEEQRGGGRPHISTSQCYELSIVIGFPDVG